MEINLYICTMKKIEELSLSDFVYDLPESKIAQFPLAKRDDSKLLVYKNNQISHHSFTDISTQIPGDSLLVFNNTRVIPARIFFQKETGATIEVFLLEPESPSKEVASCMESQSPVEWVCAIGNLKKWKENTQLSIALDGVTLNATLLNRESQLVELSWNNPLSFSEILEITGKIPLPPYIKRKAETVDLERYQTVYSLNKGAVAAPTAGLHFTDEILNTLQSNGTQIAYTTLHVGSGTFKPVKNSKVYEHPMHYEEVQIELKLIEKILNNKGKIIPIGTTSMRTLESLFWYGYLLSIDTSNSFVIDKDLPYHTTHKIPSLEESFQLIYAKHRHEKTFSGNTGIYILPGYTFRVCQGLVTNFHMPGSTLIMLIAAFTGQSWKTIYNAALENNYRFLSYGDSSLILPNG